MGNPIVASTLTIRDMTDIQQSPIAAVPGASELSATEGARNADVQASTPAASQAATPAQGSGSELSKEVELINRITGRQYKTLEDAEKGVKETYSHVGSLGQKASIVDKLAEKIARENNVSQEAALEYVTQLTQAELAQAEQAASAPSEDLAKSAPASAKSPQDFHLQQLQEQLQEERLLRKFPEAEEQLDLIKRVSKADGRDFAEIYEKDIRPLVDLGKKQAYGTQTSKQMASVVTNGQVAGEPDTYTQVFKDFTNGKASVMDVLKAKGLRVASKE